VTGANAATPGADHTARGTGDFWQEILALNALARQLRRRGDSDTSSERAEFLARIAFLRAAAPLQPPLAVFLPLLSRIALGPLTLAQIGQTLDGRIATDAGHSHYINGPESLDHLHRLRALADAVVVGAATVDADDPRLTTRRVDGPNPTRVVIDPRRRLAQPRRIFDDSAPTLVIAAAGRLEATGEGGGTTIVAVDAEGGGDRLPPRAILDALWQRGLQTVLIEGGGATISAFLQAQAVDRMHVMVAPMLLGSGRSSLRLPPTRRIEDGIGLDWTVYPLGGDILFDCGLR
jgi:riboflavin-specific deaminase-like protein